LPPGARFPDGHLRPRFVDQISPASQVFSLFRLLQLEISAMVGVHFPRLSTAPVVGISGSRSPSEDSLQALYSIIHRLSSSCQVVVGCARGIDAAVRSAVPAGRLHIFEVASIGTGRWAFAARSTACVKAVREALPSCLWISFPSAPCPSGLVPSASASACFAGYGSGSWASLAYAIGSGIPCLVFLPAGVPSPATWPLVQVSGTSRWYRFVSAVIQRSLF